MDVRSAQDYVYLDYAATAPLCEEALEAMAPYMVAGAPSVMADGNANSLHTPGRLAFERLEKARKRFAAAVGASRPAEIVFTGGATEADNAALVGLAHAAVRKRAQEGRACRNPRIVVSSIEIGRAHV